MGIGAPFASFNDDGEVMKVEFPVLFRQHAEVLPAGTRAQENHPSVSRASTSWAIDKEAVSPGDSIPNRCTSRGRPWSDGVSITKSAAGSPWPVNLGRIPA